MAQTHLRHPAFQAHRFDSISLVDLVAAGHGIVGLELTIEERRAALVRRFGRVGRARALWLPEYPARVFDDLDDLREVAHD